MVPEPPKVAPEATFTAPATAPLLIRLPADTATFDEATLAPEAMLSVPLPSFVT
jgi:hypothetical protein